MKPTMTESWRNGTMNRWFTSEEVKSVTTNLPKKKCPRPSGFSGAHLKKN